MPAFTKVKLKDVCESISSGGTPSRKRLEYFDSATGHLWVKSKELLEKGITDTEEKISEAGLRNSSARYYPVNTVLVAMYGVNAGQLAWLKSPATVNQAICALVVDSRKADWRFVYYSLLESRRGLVVQARGGAQPNLNKEMVANFETSICTDISTQALIGSILSAYDDLIEVNEGRIHVLEEIARVLYTEWFVRLKFPGYEKVNMVDSGTEFGSLPHGWVVRKLEDVADLNKRSIKSGNAPQLINYVDIASVAPGRIRDVQPMLFASAPGRARRVVRPGDIIWSNVRPERRAYSLIINPPPSLVVSTGFTVVSATGVPYSYLYHALTTDGFVGYLVNHARGAAYPAVVSEDFAKALVVVPEKGILEEFHKVVVGLLQEKELIIRANSCLSRMRNLLIPQLVTGNRMVR